MIECLTSFKHRLGFHGGWRTIAFPDSLSPALLVYQTCDGCGAVRTSYFYIRKSWRETPVIADPLPLIELQALFIKPEGMRAL